MNNKCPCINEECEYYKKVYNSEEKSYDKFCQLSRKDYYSLNNLFYLYIINKKYNCPFTKIKKYLENKKNKIQQDDNMFEITTSLEKICDCTGKKCKYLKQIRESYPFKDICKFKDIHLNEKNIWTEKESFQINKRLNCPFQKMMLK